MTSEREVHIFIVNCEMISALSKSTPYVLRDFSSAHYLLQDSAQHVGDCLLLLVKEIAVEPRDGDIFFFSLIAQAINQGTNVTSRQ